MKRLKQLGIGLLVFVAAIALIVILGEAIFHSVGSRKLADETARIDAEEPGWRLQDLEAARQAAKPPDAVNSSLIVLELQARTSKAWDLHRQSEDSRADSPLNRTPAFSQLIWMLAARTDTRDVRDASRERLLKPELLAQPGGQYPLEIKDNPFTTLLPHADKTRALAALLNYDARLSALEGDPDRGIRSARAGLVVARSMGDEPFLISQLVRIACAKVAAQSVLQVLAWNQPKNGLAELQAELRTEADFPWLLTGLRGERAILDRVFESLESGKMTHRDLDVIMGEQRNGPLDAAAFKLYRGFLPGDHAKALELLSAYIQAAKLPSHEQLAAIKAIPHPPRPPEDFRYLVSALVLPACAKVAEASVRIRADLLAASAAVACERFRIANRRWPNSLDEIPKSILPEIPTDPYDGQPLRYVKMADGIAVYSIGDLNDQTRRQRRESGDPIADLGQGWKLWNPELRGIPGVADVQNP